MGDYVSEIWDSHHSKISINNKYDHDLINKKIALSGYNCNPLELSYLYLKYREQVENIYPKIPKLFTIDIIDKDLCITEEFISGQSLKDIIVEGNKDKWIFSTQTLFTPLLKHIKQTPLQIDQFTSHFPLDICLDIKPANIVLHNNERIVPVDFFPPLLRSENSEYYPHTLNSQDTNLVKYSYGDFEVLLAKHFSETQYINSDFSTNIKNDFIKMCDQFDTSGFLATRIIKNVIETDARCPNCLYCLGKVQD